MQGRVREGGDHLAAFGFKCNRRTSAKGRLDGPAAQPAAGQRISLFHDATARFPVAAHGFPS
jgi:hypothetical protein